MAFYAPHNEFFLPNPMLIGQSTPDFTKYFIYGSAYGGIISILYCNPIPRAIKFTLTWGAVFGFGFTRGLYNSPGYLKRTDLFKPDLDRDSDWIPGHLIKEHYKREELLDWSS